MSNEFRWKTVNSTCYIFSNTEFFVLKIYHIFSLSQRCVNCCYFVVNISETPCMFTLLIWKTLYIMSIKNVQSKGLSVHVLFYRADLNVFYSVSFMNLNIEMFLIIGILQIRRFCIKINIQSGSKISIGKLWQMIWWCPLRYSCLINTILTTNCQN